MAARVPRRTFASPFVVTLAAAPACYTSSSPAPQAWPPPPAEQAQPTPAAAPTQAAAPPDFQSPAPVIANPPPPGTATAPAQQASWTVFKSKDGCMAAIKVSCPTGEPGKPMPTCNPPPPFRYDCPNGVTLEKPITVITFGDSCALEPEPIHCPPRVACNPPRPRTVPCPKP